MARYLSAADDYTTRDAEHQEMHAKGLFSFSRYYYSTRHDYKQEEAEWAARSGPVTVRYKGEMHGSDQEEG